MADWKWAPLIGYNGGTLQLCLPQRWWEYETKPVGGSRVFSSGILESFEIRTDYMMVATIRFFEKELLDVQNWLLWGMKGGQFTYRFAWEDPTTEFLCYLQAPSFDDGFKPRRSSEYPDVFEAEIAIRRASSLPMLTMVGQNTQECGTGMNTGTTPLEWVLTNLDASALPGGAGRYILALAGPYGSGASLDDPTTVFTPGPIDDSYLARSAAPWLEFISRPLTAGYLSPVMAQMGGGTPAVPAADWARMGANMTVKHMRGATVLASFTSADQGFGWLGGGDYDAYSISGIGDRIIEDGDQILLQMNSYYQPATGVSDDGGRLWLAWGAVPGPLTTTRMYASGNVTEL